MESRLCCRTTFRRGELLRPEPSRLFQFSGYQLQRHSRAFSEFLLSCVCAFLNSEGFILVGVRGRKEQDPGTVWGVQLSTSQKKVFQQFLELICSRFYPPITLQNQLRVAFVPVQNVPGYFVIRLAVKGRASRFYSFQKDYPECRWRFFTRVDLEIREAIWEQAYQEIVERSEVEDQDKRGHQCAGPAEVQGHEVGQRKVQAQFIDLDECRMQSRKSRQ